MFNNCYMMSIFIFALRKKNVKSEKTGSLAVFNAELK